MKQKALDRALATGLAEGAQSQVQGAITDPVKNYLGDKMGEGVAKVGKVINNPPQWVKQMASPDPFAPRTA